MTLLRPATVITAIALSLVALPLSSQGAAAKTSTTTGKVVGVHDGDTLTLLTSRKKEIKVRLEGIDAPEIGQAFGNSSRQSLSDMVFGKQVKIVISTTDDYGRKIANVYVGDLWVNLAMVEKGMAWQYTHYSHDQNLKQAEVHARSEHIGLWQDKKPVPPWDYRHGKAKK